MEIAKKAISGMIDSMERITVAELVKRTGLSRGFFYKNQMVRRELDDAIHRQEAIFKNQHPVIMDRQLENSMVDLLKAQTKNEKLSEQNQELQKKNKQLQQEVEKLNKRLSRKEVSVLKKL